MNTKLLEIPNKINLTEYKKVVENNGSGTTNTVTMVTAHIQGHREKGAIPGHLVTSTK